MTACSHFPRAFENNSSCKIKFGGEYSVPVIMGDNEKIQSVAIG